MICILCRISDTVSASEARVLSMVLQHQPSGVLWVGLASGHILLMNSVSKQPIMATRRHGHSVCCIRLVETVLNEKPLRHVLSSGYGFLQRPGSDAPKKGKNSAGCCCCCCCCCNCCLADFEHYDKQLVVHNSFQTGCHRRN